VIVKHIVDWLSWTQAVQIPSNQEELGNAIEDSFRDSFGNEISKSVFGDLRWGEALRGRAPFSLAWKPKDVGITIFANQNLAYLLVEASGRGCDYLRKSGKFGDILGRIHKSVTRIDLATDMDTIHSPKNYVDQCKEMKVRSRAEMNSDEGETIYLGSPKSERFTRVYKYAEPHPRSKLLRVEQVFRRKHARAIASALVEQDVAKVSEAAARAYHLDVTSWLDNDVQKGEVSFPRAERNMGGTTFWLIKQVAPAFRRLVREGIITDPDAFLKQYFIDAT